MWELTLSSNSAQLEFSIDETKLSFSILTRVFKYFFTFLNVSFALALLSLDSLLKGSIEMKINVSPLSFNVLSISGKT